MEIKPEKVGTLNYIKHWGFHNEGNLKKRNVDDSDRHPSSVRGESAADRLTLHPTMEAMNKQFMKLSERSQDGETRRQSVEKKVWGGE